ncbi:hypothetical protein FOZ63_022055, partial [Perkinsus olseni]
REIISLVRLVRSESSKAKKDDGGISRAAECIDTLNELILSVPSASLLMGAKDGGVSGGQEGGYPLSPLPLTAPLILYPITNSAPLGAMGVSAEGRFVLLWLAASVLGRPLLLWDRIEELKQSSMRIDVEEVRASLA